MRDITGTGLITPFLVLLTPKAVLAAHWYAKPGQFVRELAFGPGSALMTIGIRSGRGFEAERSDIRCRRAC